MVAVVLGVVGGVLVMLLVLGVGLWLRTRWHRRVLDHHADALDALKVLVQKYDRRIDQLDRRHLDELEHLRDQTRVDRRQPGMDGPTASDLATRFASVETEIAVFRQVILAFPNALEEARRAREQRGGPLSVRGANLLPPEPAPPISVVVPKTVPVLEEPDDQGPTRPFSRSDLATASRQNAERGA